MSKLSQFLVDSILNEAESDVVTALFGGGFKPPTKGHLEVVLKAIQDNPEIDQVYIIVGSGVRNGISQEQSVKIWEKYKQFIPKTIEIIEAGSPMSWIKDYLKDHPEDKTYILIGAREGNEEDEKDVEQRSNLFQKYGGEIKPIYTVGGISGTKAREAAKQSKEAFYQFLPNQLSDSDKEEIYNIIIPTLNEVGEGSSKPYEWREDFGEYFFTTDNNVKYIVSLEKMPEGDKIGISVEFLAKTPGMQGYSSKIEVGKGELFRVMATIIDIIKSHLSKDPEIEFILYSPHKKSGEGDIGNQRDKLYKIFLQKQIPGIRIRDIGTSAVIAYLPQKSELNENASYSSDIDYKSLIKELTKYMIKDGWNILPLPKVIFKHGDSENARDFFGKTAYYNPNNQTIVLYTEGRHPKDIVRSFSHEMVHHEQNLDGRLGDIQTTNTQEDDYLNDIEAEANLNGTMTFRNWTDSLNENVLPQEKFAQEYGQDLVKKALSILPQKEKYNLKDYTVKILPIDKVKPTQFGEDYINASSEYEAEQYKKYIEGKIEVKDLRKEDFYPIIVDKDTMEILDGNHRHAVHTILGIPKIKAILVSKTNNNLNENQNSKATKVFVMKSPFTPKGWDFDHIGFVLDNGMLKDMSGHRYDKDQPMPPMTYKYEDTEELFQMPKDKNEAIKKGLYKEKSLPKPIEIPSNVACDIKDPNKKAINCGSFVKIVLSNSGIETTKSNKPGDIFKAIPTNTLAESGQKIAKKNMDDYKKSNNPSDKVSDPFGLSQYARELAQGLEEELDEGRKKKPDPKKGTGKKPKGSDRRLYTDEDPSDTVSIEFRTKEDIVNTLNKTSFKNKPHARQSQIINLIHQRVRAAYQNAKDAETKARLKRGLDYIESRKEASKEKTKRLRKENLSENQNPQEKLEYYKNYYINLSPSIFDITTKNDNIVISGIDKNYPQNFNVENVRQVPINENVPSAKDDGKATPYGSGYEKVKEEMFQSSKIENQLKQKYSEVLEKLFLFEKGNYIELNLIKIKPEYKGQGWATKILDDLSEYAQENNKILTLTPSDTFGASKSRLEKFYKRFGFVPNKGKNKDFTTKDAMIRPLSEDTSELFTIYLDLDGVIADFDKRFKELAGMGPREYEDSFGTEKFWDFIDNKHGVKFWTGIEWMPEGKKLYNFIKQFDHKLLSAPSRNDASKTGKRIWAKKNTPGTQLILAAAVNKQNYADKSNILIDDREKNIQQWKDAGGIGILFKSTDQVIDELKKIMNL
jgi:phosphopantetheine adenylyltransferase